MQIAECKATDRDGRRSSFCVFRFSTLTSQLLGLVAIALLVAPAFVDQARAGKFNKAVSVGDKAKPWRDLVGTDDRRHSLDDLKDAKLVVLVFTCNHCPVAAAYEKRILALARDYAAQGVRFVAVNCNNGEADALPAMKARAAASKYPFPYLYDPTQRIGRDYGARVTPEAFVLRSDRTIGYLGTIDDNWNDETAVKRHYLRDALDALLAGRDPETTETRPRGCGIQYED